MRNWIIEGFVVRQKGAKRGRDFLPISLQLEF